MLTYILTRVVSMLISLVAVSIIAFLIIQLPPGDFIDYLETRSIGTEPQFVSEEEVEALRAQYGLDRPIYVQYLSGRRGSYGTATSVWPFCGISR